MFSFKNIAIHALYYNIGFLQLQHSNPDMYRPFLVGRCQGVHINISIKPLYKY